MQAQSCDGDHETAVLEINDRINESLIGAARYDREYVTPTEMKSKGWTISAIAKYLGKPDKVAPNPHYRRAAKMRLYKVDRVRQAEKSPEFRQWQQSRIAQQSRSESSASAKERRFQKFAKKYQTWETALGDGCDALFNLNRYAKHRSCSLAHKRDIYFLKNEMIRLLYQHGYCVECYQHSVKVDDRARFWRAGARFHGSGVVKTLRFVVFRFLVESASFTWHQPEDYVDFSYVLTHPEADWKPSDEEKEVSLSATKFAEAKDLLRWMISQKQIAAIQLTEQTAQLNGVFERNEQGSDPALDWQDLDASSFPENSNRFHEYRVEQ
jgi:hypothetical protein